MQLVDCFEIIKSEKTLLQLDRCHDEPLTLTLLKNISKTDGSPRGPIESRGLKPRGSIVSQYQLPKTVLKTVFLRSMTIIQLRRVSVPFCFGCKTLFLSRTGEVVYTISLSSLSECLQGRVGWLLIILTNQGLHWNAIFSCVDLVNFSVKGRKPPLCLYILPCVPTCNIWNLLKNVSHICQECRKFKRS